MLQQRLPLLLQVGYFRRGCRRRAQARVRWPRAAQYLWVAIIDLRCLPQGATSGGGCRAGSASVCPSATSCSSTPPCCCWTSPPGALQYTCSVVRLTRHRPVDQAATQLLALHVSVSNYSLAHALCFTQRPRRQDGAAAGGELAQRAQRAPAPSSPPSHCCADHSATDQRLGLPVLCSGLDSTTALQLVESLHSLAAGGRAIITTIHQPSARLYGLLDKLMLLADGRPLYYGRVRCHRHDHHKTRCQTAERLCHKPCSIACGAESAL